MVCMRRKILSIQNIACETLGSLEEPLRSEGYELYEIQAHSDQIPKCADEFSAIIILGGPMSVYEGIEYLKKEQALIWDANQKQVPTLGICLGSQLIAGALGGTVHRGIKKEIGWHDIHITSAGLNGLFKGFGQKDLRVFQWHGDTYTLPSNTKILAYSDLYPQAFQIGNAYGLQFHLEVTMGMIRTWLEKYKEETTKEGLNANSILPRKEDEIQELNTKCKKVWSNFSEIISSRN
jgi:GMP synthase (glutamine-hydrolysing)